MDINLDSYSNYHGMNFNQNHLENVSLPASLKILKAQRVSTRSLISLIENTKGFLIEISIDHDNASDDDKKGLFKQFIKTAPILNILNYCLEIVIF